MRKFLNPLTSLADLAFPRFCLVCGRNLFVRERHLCTTCLADLPKTHFELLRNNPMSDLLNAWISSGRYSYATALIHYRGDYASLTKSLKFHRNFAAGRFLAGMLAESLSRSALYSDVDAVTCVPLHWTRRLSRGYNQAEILAVTVSGTIGVPFIKALYRRRRTSRQARLGGPDEAALRAANVRGAFAVRKSALPALSGCRHILLLDDVFTTGATMYACFDVLRSVLGPDVRISVATLAFAGGR